MERKRIGKWVLSVLLWFWTGGVYFFGEVIWKTSQGRPETISWTMFALAIILAVPLERFGAELPWGMPLVMLSLVTSIRAKDELFSLCNGMVARGDAVPAVRVRGITRKCSGRFANPQATPMLAARWSDTTW